MVTGLICVLLTICSGLVGVLIRLIDYVVICYLIGGLIASLLFCVCVIGGVCFDGLLLGRVLWLLNGVILDNLRL